MKFDICIIGAGIVGASTAYQLLLKNPGLKILLLDKESSPAAHQTGHNSGVIHSGIYYKPGSYKAKNCLEGYQMLLDFCNSHGIPYQKTGKLIVASKPNELPSLERIHQNGIQNGLKDLQLLGPESIQEIEPNVRSIKAILVPQACIIDYIQVVRQLIGLCVEKGLTLSLNKEVATIRNTEKAIEIICEDQSCFTAEFLINCAGLQSDRIARISGIHMPYHIIPFKGIYYKLIPEKKDIVARLIYPVPDLKFPFLGIHYTRTMSGEQTLGPNAILAYDREGYRPGSFRWKDTLDTFAYPGFWKLILNHWQTGLQEYRRNYSIHFFAKKASEMTPGIVASDLSYHGSGIRAQVVNEKGAMVDDFLHFRVPKMIHICNAPSPAATAGLSIGKQIADWYFEQRT